MAVRIYYLAKELGFDSKELVDLCAKVGIRGKGSALASLEDDEIARIRNYINDPSKPLTPIGHDTDSTVAASSTPERQPIRVLGSLRGVGNLMGTQLKREANPESKSGFPKLQLPASDRIPTDPPRVNATMERLSSKYHFPVSLMTLSKESKIPLQSLIQACHASTLTSKNKASDKLTSVELRKLLLAMFENESGNKIFESLESFANKPPLPRPEVSKRSAQEDLVPSKAISARKVVQSEVANTSTKSAEIATSQVISQPISNLGNMANTPVEAAHISSAVEMASTNLAPELAKQQPIEELQATTLADAVTVETLNMPKSEIPNVEPLESTVSAAETADAETSVAQIAAIDSALATSLATSAEVQTADSSLDTNEPSNFSEVTEAFSVSPSDVESLQMASLVQSEFDATPQFAEANISLDASKITVDSLKAQGIFLEAEIVRRLAISIAAGRHLLLIGPPGSGKTELAKALPKILFGEDRDHPYRLTTAHAGWTTHDIVGGPTFQGGSVTFSFGEFSQTILDSCNRGGAHWLIIDEINRCDIDRVLGPVFTTLQDGIMRLPTNAGCGDLPIPNAFRVVATMNSADRNSLFPMSVALLRRFAVIEIPPLEDLNLEKEMVQEHLRKYAESGIGMSHHFSKYGTEEFEKALDGILEFFHGVRKSAHSSNHGIVPELCVGSATVIEVVKYVLIGMSMDESIDVEKLVDEAIRTIYLPQLEGVLYSFGKIVVDIMETPRWNLKSSKEAVKAWHAKSASLI